MCLKTKIRDLYEKVTVGFNESLFFRSLLRGRLIIFLVAVRRKIIASLIWIRQFSLL